MNLESKLNEKLYDYNVVINPTPHYVPDFEDYDCFHLPKAVGINYKDINNPKIWEHTVLLLQRNRSEFLSMKLKDCVLWIIKEPCQVRVSSKPENDYYMVEWQSKEKFFYRKTNEQTTNQDSSDRA